MKNLLSRIVKFFRKTPRPHVRVTEEGLAVVTGGKTVGFLRWADVRTIVTFKHDLFAHDEICLAFLHGEGAETWLEISEEWEGFIEAAQEMRKRFPSIAERWYEDVMLPAFERKQTVLYERT